MKLSGMIAVVTISLIPQITFLVMAFTYSPISKFVCWKSPCSFRQLFGDDLFLPQNSVKNNLGSLDVVQVLSFICSDDLQILRQREF